MSPTAMLFTNPTLVANQAMARRNRKSRAAQQAARNQAQPPTEEDLSQERNFFIWVGVITVVIVLALYLFLFL